MQARIPLVLAVWLLAGAISGCETTGHGANNLDQCFHPHSVCYSHRAG